MYGLEHKFVSMRKVKLPTGDVWPIHESVMLGKRCLRNKPHAQLFVPINQCSIDCRTKPSDTAYITVAGKQPILLIRHADGSRIRLTDGQRCELHHKDTICLRDDLPESTAVEFVDADNDDDSNDADDATNTKEGEKETARTDEKVAPIMLLLVGYQGSGKSQLASKLPKDSWCVVSNDTAAAASSSHTYRKAACVARAHDALTSSNAPKHVCVDNTNTTEARRRDYVHLAKSVGAPLHAVVLNLPPETCAQRVRTRSQHPSLVQGSDGVNVLKREEQLQLPSKEREGFDTVHTCHLANQCEDVAQMYAHTKGPDHAHVEAACDASKDQALLHEERAPKKLRTTPASPKEALQLAADTPQALDTYVTHTEHLVLLNDKFPKGKLHALVVARDTSVASVHCLHSKEHAELLSSMISLAQDYVHHQRQRDRTIANVVFGFHSMPSMHPLHMHVISQDLSGEYMKSKMHWNSFSTPFLMDARQVYRQVLQAGKVSLTFDPEQLLKQKPRCHRVGCKKDFSTFPACFSHATRHCTYPLPGND